MPAVVTHLADCGCYRRQSVLFRRYVHRMCRPILRLSPIFCCDTFLRVYYATPRATHQPNKLGVWKCCIFARTAQLNMLPTTPAKPAQIFINFGSTRHNIDSGHKPAVLIKQINFMSQLCVLWRFMGMSHRP